MKSKLKLLGTYCIILLLTFLVIYLLVFFGGWRLIESGDPILIELAVSVVASLIILTVYVAFERLSEAVSALEKRIAELEANIDKR